jgi:hypothetical protein
MPFFLGLVSFSTSQQTKYLSAFRAFCSDCAFKSRFLKELASLGIGQGLPLLFGVFQVIGIRDLLYLLDHHLPLPSRRR